MDAPAISPVTTALDSERRRSDRYPAVLPVALRRQGRQEWLQTLDVSRHGAFLRTDSPRPERELVQLSFVMPDGVTLDALCTVTRSLRVGTPFPPGPGMGVEFFSLGRDAKDQWDAFVRGRKLAALHALPSLPPIMESTQPVLAPAPSPEADAPPVPGPRTPPPLPADAHASEPPAVVPLSPPAAVAAALPGPPPMPEEEAGLPVVEGASASPAPVQESQPVPMLVASEPPPVSSSAPVVSPRTRTPVPPAAPPPTARADGPPLPFERSSPLVGRPPPRLFSVPPPAAAPLRSSSIRSPRVLPPEQPPPPPSSSDIPPVATPVRRRHVRVAACFIVRLRDRVHIRSFYTRDISNGGCFVATPDPRAVGERVELILVHPATDDEYRLRARVMRTVDDGPEEQRGNGVAFEPLEPAEGAELEAFIETGIRRLLPAEEARRDRMALLARAVADQPDNWEAHFELGVHLVEEMEDAAGGVRALRRAVELHPSHAPAHRKLHRALVLDGQGAVAAEHLHVAVALENVASSQAQAE